MFFKNHSTTKPTLTTSALPLFGQKESSSGMVRGVVVSAILLLGLGAVALGIIKPSQVDAADSTSQSANQVAPEQRLVLNVVAVPASIEAAPVEQASEKTPFIVETRIRSGDTLATVLKRVDVSDSNLLSFLTRDPKARAV